MGNTAVKKTKGSGFFSNLVRQQNVYPGGSACDPGCVQSDRRSVFL